MKKRSKAKGSGAATFAACPSCFAMIASPFISWHLAKCPSSSAVPKSVDTDLAPVTPTIKKEVDETNHRFSAPETFVPIKKEMGETNRSSSAQREVDRTSPSSSSPETREAETNRAPAPETFVSRTHADGLTSELESQAQTKRDLPPEKGGVVKTSDGPRLDMQHGVDSQISDLEARKVKAATPILKGDGDESLCKLKVLEVKYNDLLKKEEDLQQQLTLSKEAEKQAWNLVELLRAELHEKVAPGPAISKCKLVEVVDLEGGSEHSNTAGVGTVTGVIPSLKKKRDRDCYSVSPNLEETSRKLDRLPEIVSQLSPKCNTGNEFGKVDIIIDALRVSNVSNGGSDSHCNTQMDQGTHSVPILNSFAPVISCSLMKDAEKLEMQDRFQSGRTPGSIAVTNPCLAGEVLELVSQSHMILGEQLESLNSSGMNNVSHKLGDFASHVPGPHSPEKAQVPEYLKLQQLFTDGVASQSPRAFGSNILAISEIQAVAKPNETESERRIVSDLCLSVSLGKAKAAGDKTSNKNMFYPESPRLAHPENKFLNRDTDLSIQEQCGLLSLQTCIDNPLHLSLSSASEETGLVIKKIKSRVRPDVIMSDSESERSCKQGVVATSLKLKQLCVLGSPVRQSYVDGHVIEQRSSQGLEGVLPSTDGGEATGQVELSQVVGRSPSGGQNQELSSVKMVGKLTNQQRAKLVKGYRKFQEDQAGELSDVSCGAGGQIKRSNAERKAKKPESPVEKTLGVVTEEKDEKEREITGVRRSKRLKLLSVQKAKINLQNNRASSQNEESSPHETKSESSGKEFSDCERISEIRGERKELSRTRRRLFNVLPQTERNVKRKLRLKVETERSGRHAGEEKAYKGSSRGRFIVDTEGSEGSEDSQAFDESESHEGSSLGGFIVDNEESENTCDKADLLGSSEEKESTDGTEASVSEDSLTLLPSSSLDFRKVIHEKRKNYAWDFEADMLAAFAKDSELCLRAVCALYRQQTEDEQMERGSKYTNKRGFDRFHATRGSNIAEFLTDGEPFEPMKKSGEDLKKCDSSAVDFCVKLAFRHSKQLFEIYKNEEDPHFPYQ